MKRLTLIALAALAALGWAAAAQAKQLSGFKVCGASGCKSVTTPALLRQLIRVVETQGAPVSTPTPAPAPFVRLEFSIRGDSVSPSFTQYYVPSSRQIAVETESGDWSWNRIAALRSLLDRVTAGVKPFPAPGFTRVLIGGKLARDPASYTKLFALRERSDNYPDEPDWLGVIVETAQPSPWSTASATLEYSPSKKVLWRGMEFIKVPSSLAGRIEARRSLRESSNQGSFAWAPVLSGVAGAAIVLLVLRNRRRSV